MMQRVVAVLTQARELLERSDWSEETGELSPQGSLMGEFIAEALRPNTVIVGVPTSQAVSDAVMAEIQPRVGQLVGCFAAAYVELAMEHDARSDKTSTEILRELMLRWELQGDEAD